MNKRILISFICYIFIASSAYAQREPQRSRLIKEVFFELEKKHQIKFSYSDNLVSNVYVSIKLNGKDLDTILREIKSQTNFIFQKVTERYIIVLNKDEKSKTAACGYLLDVISQEPLMEASITILSRNTGTTTDRDGYFQLESVAANDTIKISFIGYLSKLFLAKELIKKPCKRIYLEEFTSVLNEIRITNYLANGITREKDGSIGISPKKLGILPGLTEPDVLQSIQFLPGINSPSETASGIHVRGGTPDQNLILFDGIKMYNSAHFFGMISSFNPYITDKIKVYRSGAGARYGNHISGVVDIETNNNITNNTNGGFGFNLTHADAFIETKLNDKIGISFSARRSFTDFINTNTFSKFSDKVFQNTIIDIDGQQSNSDLFSDNNDFHFVDFNSKIIYEPTEKDKIIFNQLMTKNKLEHLFKFNDNSYSTRDVLNINNDGFSIKWFRNWNKKLSQRTSFYYSKYDLEYLFEAVQDVANRDQSRAKQNQIKDANFQTSFSFKKSDVSQFDLGYEYDNSKVFYSFESVDQLFPQNNFALLESNRNITHAVFGEYAYNNKEKQTVQLGLRSNYFSLTKKFFIAPRLYLQFQLAPKFWAKGSLEFKQQNISQLLELSTADFGLENQIWALSNNNNVPVLRSNQTTVGFIFKRDNWTVDLDLYLKKVRGITTVSSGFQTVNNTFSEGTNNIRGIDFLIQKKWNDYSSWISYSFNNGDLTFSNINQGHSFPSNTDVSHNFFWTHNIKTGNYQFSLGWNYRSGVPFTRGTGLDASNQIIYQNINSSRLPSYHRLDFSSTYSFHLNSNRTWKGRIGLSLINVYNKKNVLQRVYSVDFDTNGNSFLVTKDISSLGFTPNMVFRVSF